MLADVDVLICTGCGVAPGPEWRWCPDCGGTLLRFPFRGEDPFGGPDEESTAGERT